MTSAVLRPCTLFWAFDQVKNRSLTALSNFRRVPKINVSLELLNMIFEYSSPKGIFKQNMSESPNGSLTDHSKSEESAALKDVRSKIIHII